MATTSKTLPHWCRIWDRSVDRVREFLRSNPELANLAGWIGGTRVFDADAAKKILAALNAAKVPVLGDELQVA